MKLRALAHSRTGDKGNISNISVIAYRDEDYPFLCEHVTAARVKEHFREIVTGDVTRYELPAISALNFVLKGALGGGVTRSRGSSTDCTATISRADLVAPPPPAGPLV